MTDRQSERKISICVQAEYCWADTNEAVASLGECVVVQQLSASGPVIMCCVHSANH